MLKLDFNVEWKWLCGLPGKMSTLARELVCSDKAFIIAVKNGSY